MKIKNYIRFFYLFIFLQKLITAATSNPEYGRNGKVVSTSSQASEAGIEILKKGGNAIDAAVAVGFALAVTSSSNGNIGGGGFLVASFANGLSITLDHREKAQTLDNHFGKIIRINKDGTIPTNNPFVNVEGALPDIYSYGHRNMQGLIVTKSGQIFEHEHGPRGGDEMNLIEPSLNYGWPAITYGIDYSGAVISPFTEKEGMEQPLFHWTPSIAPSDMIFYEGNRYPKLKNSFLVTALVSKDVKQVTFSESGKEVQESLFSELNSRLRNIQASPDGLIYLMTDGPRGKLIKVVPEGLWT